MSVTPEQRLWLVIGLALAVLVSAAHLGVSAYYGDGEGWSVAMRDAYLQYQYGAAWSGGHPYAFLPGDAPTTGATSHLYPALLGAFHALGARGDALSVVAGLLAAAAYLTSLGLLWAIARRIAAGAVPLAMILCAASGQLTTSLFGQSDSVVFVPLALGCCAALLYGRPLGLGVLLVLLALARPEGAVVAAALLVASWLSGSAPIPQRALRLAALAGIVTTAATLLLNRLLTGRFVFDSVLAKGLFHENPPLAALALLGEAAAELFVELGFGIGDEARQMYLLPLLGGPLVALGFARRAARVELFERFWLAALLATLGLGLLGGGSGLHRDRYLAWLLPIALVYAAAGARGFSEWCGSPRVYALLVLALGGFQLLGAGYAWSVFAEGNASTASNVRFVRQLNETLPAGSRIGVASGAGLAYFLPGHHVSNVNGVVSAPFSHPDPNVVGAEILAQRPELRFDHWLLPLSSLGRAWYRPFVGRGISSESPEVNGSHVLALYAADWSSLPESPAPAPNRVEVGWPESETQHDYRLRARDPGLWIEPLLVTGKLDGVVRSDVGRVALEGERFRLPAPISERAVLRLRTAWRADALVRRGRELRVQRFHTAVPLELELRVAGESVARPSLAVRPEAGSIQEFDIPFTLPAAAEGPLEVEVIGDYLSLGWSLHEAGEGPGASASRPPKAQIVMIVVDTLRRDSVGVYGREASSTPAMDSLARDGTRFDRAISSSGWTLPAMASLLTGAWPSVHKALGQRTRLTPISADLPTAAEVLQEAGLRTLAVANAAFVSPYLGLGRGFDVFDHRHAYNREIRRAGESLDRALELIDEDPGAPFFLLVHLFDPHLDYDPLPDLAEPFARTPREPAPPLSRREGRALAESGPPSAADVAWVRGLYEAEVAGVDRALGRFLEALAARGLYDDTLIVLTSDHGEEFWEHGDFEHGHGLHDELVRVPMIVKLPGTKPQRGEVAAQVRVLDLFPTIFDLYGVEQPDTFQGRTLLGLIAGTENADRVAFSESTLYGSQKRALRDGRFTYILDSASDSEPPEALYDWQGDPQELRNLIGERPELAESARARYRAFEETLHRDAAGTRLGPVLNMAPGQFDRVREMLESLGYVESEAEGGAAGR